MWSIFFCGIIIIFIFFIIIIIFYIITKSWFVLLSLIILSQSWSSVFGIVFTSFVKGVIKHLLFHKASHSPTLVKLLVNMFFSHLPCCLFCKHKHITYTSCCLLRIYIHIIGTSAISSALINFVLSCSIQSIPSETG